MFPEKIHRALFLFGAFTLAFGMMMGAVPTSVPQCILLGNWLIEFGFRRKWQMIRGNRLFWILVSVFLIHAAGLLYSSDVKAGFDDLLIKAPLLVLPLIFFTTKPLSLKELHAMLLCFLLGSLVNTAWCLTYSFVLHRNEVGRDASRFMSHIRLGLYLNMAIACCMYFAVIAKSFLARTFASLGTLYFLLVIYTMGLASGLVNFFILAFVAVCVILFRQNIGVKAISFLLLVIVTGFSLRYIADIAGSQLTVKPSRNNVQLRRSPSGRHYTHFDTKGQIENGNYVLINIQLDELKDGWARHFPEDSFSFHPKAHNIHRYEVLIRYLASKGLNKDSVGLSQLSISDRDNIRQGICNYRYNEWSFLHKRIYELVCEYDDLVNGRDVNGHSLTMRFYFWDAAVKVIRDHPLFGTGTGDVQTELNRIYVQSHSPLAEQWHKRPHNQFLTILLSLGIPGLLIFLMSIFYPLVYLKSYLPVLYAPFIILALVSFIVEDTLETQAGVTFFAVFNTILIVHAWFKRTALTNGGGS